VILSAEEIRNEHVGKKAKLILVSCQQTAELRTVEGVITGVSKIYITISTDKGDEVIERGWIISAQID